MIIARAAQGLGGAIVAPAALSIVTSLFTEARERNIAMSVWGGSAPAGGAAGVLLGGVFTDTIGWRWVFFVNVPVVLLVMLLAPVVLRRDESSARRARLDLPGAVSVTAGLFLAVFGIVQAEKSGFGSAGALGLLGGAVVLLAAFVVIEKNTAEPLVPLTIFRNRNLTVGSLVMLLLGAAWIPAWYFISLYMQTVLDFSALRTGLGYLPMTIGIFALSMLLVARTLGRFGFKLPLIVGLLALTAGTLAFSFAPDDGSYAAAVLPASLLLAIGMAFAYVPATVASLSAVTPETAGLASGLISTTYQIGSALGLAITAAVAAARTDGSDTVAALNSGYGTAFAATAIIAAVAILLALAIRKPGAAGPVAAGGSTEAAAQEEPSRA
jgi:MFS family permease